MADDRLDDAIAAVARAVARIEAISRGIEDPPLPDLPPVREPRLPPPPSFTEAPSGFAARPTTALGVSRVPEPEYPPVPLTEPASGVESAPDFESAPAYDPADDVDRAYDADPEGPSEIASAYAAESLEPAGEPAATPTPTAEIHELVGRIIARTQTLEEHLDAARQLRFEITDLVSRLAAVAERDR